MAAFKFKYYDLRNDEDKEHEIVYDGPEMSERNTWHWAIDTAINWCNENRMCFESIENICM